jgi:ribosomal protein S11
MNLPRHAEIWLLPYLKDRLRKRIRPAKPKRAWVAITDHYEPLGMGASVETALGRVAHWRDKWPRIADDAPLDAAGQRPQYSFFYPQEEYRRDILDGIAKIVRLGIADVEVHLHHDNEQRESFIRKVTDYCRRLTDDHGLLRQQDGRTVFGFIHGNWALDNSRPDGKACGLNGEIALLRDLGCYADFTMPSLPSPTQGRIVNQIYWCTNNPDNRPRSFDRGIEATCGGGRRGDLLMITGPVGLRFGERLLPRMEAGEIAGYDLPTPARVHRWFDLAPTIGDDLFLKLFTHGAQERNSEPLLGGGLSILFRCLTEEAERRGIEIHWATAWQMYQAADALISGRKSAMPSAGM